MWGDDFQGVRFQLARNALMKMDLTKHTKNWRPQLLVVTGADVSEHSTASLDDLDILSFVSQLTSGRDITIIGGFRQYMADGQDEMKKVMREYSNAGFDRIVKNRQILRRADPCRTPWSWSRGTGQEHRRPTHFRCPYQYEGYGHCTGSQCAASRDFFRCNVS